MRETEHETALDVRYSELKRELKEFKKARQHLGVAGVATGDALYGAAFVKPSALGAVKRQKRSRSGSRSSSVFRGARGNDHDPAASKLALWAESNPAHTLQRMADQLVDGIGGRWTALPPAPNPATHPALGPKNLRELETLSKVLDQPAAGRSSSGRCHPALQSHRNGHAGRRLEVCVSSGAFAQRKASPHGERRTRVHQQGPSARGEAEKVPGRGPRSEVEGLRLHGKGRRKRQTLGQGESTPHFKGQSKGKSSDKSKTFERGLLLRGVGSQTVGGSPGAC